MLFLSEAASAIKSRFRFHDYPSESLSLVQNTPDLLKSAAKDTLAQSSVVRTINDWDDESVVGPSSTAVLSNQSFEFCEDPSFWKDHNVQVIIRMHPLTNAEISLQGYGKCVRQESCQTITWTGHPELRFTFDLVADENVSQEKLFKVAGLPMVENCMGGYNSCMFAYGQTGSGKTHIMLGDIEGGISLLAFKSSHNLQTFFYTSPSRSNYPNSLISRRPSNNFIVPNNFTRPPNPNSQTTTRKKKKKDLFSVNLQFSSHTHNHKKKKKSNNQRSKMLCFNNG